MIELRGLYAGYDGAEILHGIDARFPKGKVSVLCGPNGCGKSTTVKALLRLVPEARGDIRIDGMPLERFSPSLSRKLRCNSPLPSLPIRPCRRLSWCMLTTVLRCSNPDNSFLINLNRCCIGKMCTFANFYGSYANRHLF